MQAPQLVGNLLVDLSARTKLLLTGADRVRFLNGQVSNDVRRATADRSVYACVMTIKGKMCADAFIHAAPAGLLTDSEPEMRETLAARLERYIIADDVQLEDVTDAFALWHLLPAAGGELPANLSGLGGDVQAVRSERFGREGIDLFFAPADAGQVRVALPGSWREPAAGELETLRITAGVPRWGAELDENAMPAEAGIEARAVDYAKGCYIGQEVVSRVKSVGRVNRTLRGLRVLDSAASLTVGTPLFPASGEAETQTRPVGVLTSVAPGEHGAPALALGYVRRGWEAAGAILEATPNPPADSPASSLAKFRVEVADLPFSP